MSALFGPTIRSLITRHAFSNKKLFSNLISNKTKESNRLLLLNPYQQQQQKQQLQRNKSDACGEEKADDCKRLTCNQKPTNQPTKNPAESEKQKAVTNTKELHQKCKYDDPECCLEKCPDANIRLDCIHYKMSDKKTRKYQQTWVECPPVRKVPKVSCSNMFTDQEPSLPLRTKKAPPAKTACSMEGNDSDLLECQKMDKKAACFKIRMSGCKEARNPPKCKSERKRSDCRKIKCPYPAFSECNKPKPAPRRPDECHCLEVRTMCDIYALAKKKGMQLTK